LTGALRHHACDNWLSQSELETMMNNDSIKGKWHQLKGEIKRKWGKITDDDLTEAEGNVEKLIGKIQERSGERRDAIEKWLDSQTT
jgi:uncharacterized protein YjbJ (UPF0337 family)